MLLMLTLTISGTLVAVIAGVTCWNPVAVMSAAFWQRRQLIREETNYEGHLESKERFAIQRYLLTIGKKKNMQVLWHTFTYFST